VFLRDRLSSLTSLTHFAQLLSIPFAPSAIWPRNRPLAARGDCWKYWCGEAKPPRLFRLAALWSHWSFIACPFIALGDQPGRILLRCNPVFTAP
jgi:hypothetical protein